MVFQINDKIHAAKLMKKCPGGQWAAGRRGERGVRSGGWAGRTRITCVLKETFLKKAVVPSRINSAHCSLKCYHEGSTNGPKK